MGHAMGYSLVGGGMQEVAPLHCDLIVGEELAFTLQYGNAKSRGWGVGGLGG